MGPTTIESAKDTRSTVRRLLRYFQPHVWQIAGVTALVILSTLLSLAGPLLLGVAIDHYIMPGDLPGLVRIALLMLATYLGASLTSAIQGFVMVGIGQRLIRDIRAQLFAHMQTLSMKYHDDHEVGDLMSRLSNDTDVINRVLSDGLIQLTSNMLTLGGIMIAMFALSWQLALGTVLILPLMMAISAAIAGRSRHAFRAVQGNLGALNAVAEENIGGARVVQAFARAPETIAEFKTVNAANRDAGVKAEIIIAALGPMFTTMSTFTIAMIAGLGGWLALRGLVTVGVIASFVVYA